jgi:energy-coupling factor transporter ATP-binding protein EcfA2
MNGAVMHASNPFSTKHVRPGAIEYLFHQGESAEGLIDKLAAAAWRGAIVGPHGSGKSTLLETLAPKLRERGREVVRFTLRAGEHRLPIERGEARRWNAATQVVVDGYEQLAWLSRCWLQSACRRASCGLLVTSHRRLRIPTLFDADTTLETAERVVRQLAAPQTVPLQPDQLAQLHQKHGGNLREVLFELYDLCESRR